MDVPRKVPFECNLEAMILKLNNSDGKPDAPKKLDGKRKRSTTDVDTDEEEFARKRPPKCNFTGQPMARLKLNRGSGQNLDIKRLRLITAKIDGLPRFEEEPYDDTCMDIDITCESATKGSDLGIPCTPCALELPRITRAGRRNEEQIEGKCLTSCDTTQLQRLFAHSLFSSPVRPAALATSTR
jgi:hypothetical protein